ncbi:hypothetical protein BH09BAC3_BH09BAC3_37920 [soil metagenome]
MQTEARGMFEINNSLLFSLCVSLCTSLCFVVNVSGLHFFWACIAVRRASLAHPPAAIELNMLFWKPPPSTSCITALLFKEG